jgi:phenylpyruvate tautomerase PptA (4-oxalocrotonate tautomerase family)
MEAVHSALVEAFKIPATDRTVRLVVHQPHRMMFLPGLAQPELFTQVSIDAFSGRSIDAKRALYSAIVTNLEQLGIPKSHVKVLLRELPKENWGIRGGQAGSDVDIGFKIEV